MKWRKMLTLLHCFESMNCTHSLRRFLSQICSNSIAAPWALCSVSRFKHSVTFVLNVEDILQFKPEFYPDIALLLLNNHSSVGEGAYCFESKCKCKWNRTWIVQNCYCVYSAKHEMSNTLELTTYHSFIRRCETLYTSQIAVCFWAMDEFVQVHAQFILVFEFLTRINVHTYLKIDDNILLGQMTREKKMSHFFFIYKSNKIYHKRFLEFFSILIFDIFIDFWR